jgi:hypothetical protein
MILRPRFGIEPNYPHITSLVLKSSSLTPSEAATIAHAFPNLEVFPSPTSTQAQSNHDSLSDSSSAPQIHVFGVEDSDETDEESDLDTDAT